MTQSLTVQSDIQNAFDARVLEFTLAQPENALPIAYQDMKFPPDDHPEYASAPYYLELRNFRNTPANPLWGTEKRLRGFWQVSVIDAGNSGAIGDFPLLAIAERLTAYFPKNLRLQFGTTIVKITDTPDILTTINSPSKTIVPVSMPYLVFDR